MLIPLASIAFWPAPERQLADRLDFLHWHGSPRWFNYQFIEVSANIVLFVPLGFVSLLTFPEKPWWRIGAFGLLASSCMELGQSLFLHNRFASPSDLVTNTSGAVIGALITSAALTNREARRLSAADSN
jgi:glycopeptide antibiotics resistance protein